MHKQRICYCKKGRGWPPCRLRRRRFTSLQYIRPNRRHCLCGLEYLAALPSHNSTAVRMIFCSRDEAAAAASNLRPYVGAAVACLPREAFTNHCLRRQAACGDSPPGRSVSCAARRPCIGRRTRHVNRLINHRGFVGSRILDFHQI